MHLYVASDRIKAHTIMVISNSGGLWKAGRGRENGERYTGGFKYIHIFNLKNRTGTKRQNVKI